MGRHWRPQGMGSCRKRKKVNKDIYCTWKRGQWVRTRVSRRNTVRRLSHRGGEMTAIPQGLNTHLMHDFGAGRLGRDRLLPADDLCTRAYWPILLAVPGPVDKRLKSLHWSFKAQKKIHVLLWSFVREDASPALCESLFLPMMSTAKEPLISLIRCWG